MKNSRLYTESNSYILGNTVKIGVDQYSFHRFFGEIYGAYPDPGVVWNLPDFLEHINSLSLEAISLETCFLPDDEQLLIEVLSNIDIDDISFAWGHPNGFMDTSADEAMEQIEKFLRLSRIFNAKVLRVVGSSIQYHHLPHRPQIELTVNRLKPLMAIAKDYEVKLALENHGDFYLNELEEILSRVDSPYLGLTLDTGNFLRFQEDPVDAICVFGPKIHLVHAKDLALIPGTQPQAHGCFGCVPAGQGLTDFPAIFAELRKFMFTGAVLIEISGVHPEYSSIPETEMVKIGLDYLINLRDRGESHD